MVLYASQVSLLVQSTAVTHLEKSQVDDLNILLMSLNVPIVTEFDACERIGDRVD